MVVLIRCNDIVSDPRVMKYVKYLQENGIEHFLIGWDRDGKNPELPHSIMWKQKAGFNVGGLQAVKTRIGWMKFVYSQMKKLKLKDAILHGCDIDSAFPVACYKATHKSNKLIFDVFDWFSATLYDQKKYVLSAFKIMERFTANQSDKIILCEPERKDQIPFRVPESKFSIFPNIPYFDKEDFLKVEEDKLFNNDLLTFSYVGGFTNTRCLFEIVSIAEKGLINLAIAGFGNDQLVKRLIRDNETCPNIKYYGKVKYEEGLRISYNSDIMYAMYSKINPNHIYAAPNKYYEAMFLGKALFTTKGTIVEKKVLDRSIGFVSEESEEDILSVIQTLSKEALITAGRNARECWINTYRGYTKDYLEHEYLKMD